MTTRTKKAVEALDRHKYSTLGGAALLGASIAGAWPAVDGVVSWMDDRYVREKDSIARSLKVSGLEEKIQGVEKQLETFQQSYETNRLLDQRLELKSKIMEVERIIEKGESTARDQAWLQDLQLRLESVNAQLRARGVLR